MASRGRDFLGGLSEDPADQILGFMQFFQSKRESYLSLVASEFEEAAEMLDESEYCPKSKKTVAASENMYVCILNSSARVFRARP